VKNGLAAAGIGFPPQRAGQSDSETLEDKRGRIDEHQSSTESEMCEDETEVSTYPTGVGMLHISGQLGRNRPLCSAAKRTGVVVSSGGPQCTEQLQALDHSDSLMPRVSRGSREKGDRPILEGGLGPRPGNAMS
jgi:hypothetical protein